MFKYIKQICKSWTINFGLLLQVVAILQTYINGLGNPELTAGIGIIVILLRFKTTKAVHEK